ncbi:MAG: acyl--CoA ligase [Planctomycetes bacterium]|nr:acyl--CoA ligase [Planctomycetota bacterium]MCW8136831.1 acyl--CoA ligase [Planctomycetota bacterium]
MAARGKPNVRVRKGAPKKSTQSRAAKPRKKAGAKPARKSAAATAPLAKPPTRRTSTSIVNVRPRFTEPLRRFSEYENVRSLIEGQAQKFGDRAFLIHEDDGREYSFARLDERTTRVANMLREAGALPGARVAVLAPNSPDFVFAFLGIMKGGYIAVPLNRALSIDTVRFALEDCGANFLVTDAATLGALGDLQSMPGLDAVFVTDHLDPALEMTHKADSGLRVLDFHASVEAASAAPIPLEHPRWWAEAEIVYTGHELDQPRGAILQHRQFLTSARWLSVWLGLGEQQRYMSVLPLFHANAQIVTLFLPLLTGGSVVLSREFSVSRVWKAVERYRVTTLSAVPSMLGILADREIGQASRVRAKATAAWPAAHESPGALAQRDDKEARQEGLARGHDIASLERVICGAAPLPTAVQKAFEKCFLVPVIEGFSMAETTGFATLNPGNGTRRIGSVGIPVGNKVAILDESRQPQPLTDWQPTGLLRMSPAVFPTAEIGEPGEICIWGENVLKEYLHRPKLNPQAFAGGWFHTGDVGRLDRDGFVGVLGKKGEAIDLGSERMMPREIDELLFAHGKVENVATLGIDHARKGPQVTTWVVMKRGTFPGGPENGRLPANDAQAETVQMEIRGYLAAKLPEKKRPTSIIFARKLPQDVAGKTRVIELRKLVQGTTRKMQSEEE